MLRSLLALAITLPVGADVMPHCGGPKVVIREPGEDCGHHGPRWRGDCRAPASCMVLEGSGAHCTLGCSSDADCAALGAGFSCSARGTPYGDHTGERRSVCARNR